MPASFVFFLINYPLKITVTCRPRLLLPDIFLL